MPTDEQERVITALMKSLDRKRPWQGLTEGARRGLVTTFIDHYERERPPTCGVGCAAGLKGEMLLCGFKKGHRGKHAWASLPTFAGGKQVEDQKAVDRAASALSHTTLGGSPPEATEALHEHALNIATIVVRVYLGLAG